MNELEDLMATMTGKERALFVPSGTMGNSIALLTHCRPGDVVLVDEASICCGRRRFALTADLVS